MCGITEDVDKFPTNNILILSYYVVNDLSRLEYILLKIMMIDNNITSAISDKVKHLI